MFLVTRPKDALEKMEERSAKVVALVDHAKPAIPEVRRGPGRPTLTNEQLLDKALDIFLEHGFEGTRIDEITALAGVAKRTIYQRYGDKETLFMAALQRAIDDFVIPLETLQAEERDDLEETLLRLARLLGTNLMTPAGLRLLRITNAESYRRPELGEYSCRYGTERTLAYLTDLFRRRAASEHPEDAARGFLYLVGGPATMAAWGVPFDMKAIDDHAVYWVKLFVDGLRAADHSFNLSKLDRNPPRAPAFVSIAPTDAAQQNELEQLRAENQQLRKLLVDSLLKSSNPKA